MKDNMELEKLEVVEHHSNVLGVAGMMIGMRMSIPINEQVLAYIDREIDDIRTDIISGTKTKDEINVLLDELQRLTVKKRDTEILIVSLKHARELGKKLDEKPEGEPVHISEHYGKLKKLLNKMES